MGLPCFLCWEIWKQRNAILFENKVAYVWKVTRVHSLFSFYVKEEKQAIGRNPRSPSFSFTRPTRFFDV